MVFCGGCLYGAEPPIKKQKIDGEFGTEQTFAESSINLLPLDVWIWIASNISLNELPAFALTDHYLANASKRQMQERPICRWRNNIIVTNDYARTGSRIYDHLLLFDDDYQNKYILDKIAIVLEVDFADYLSRFQPYLSSEQIKKLIDDGFNIGSHSIDHPEYRFLPYEEQIKQTKESVKMICDNFSLSYKSFSFPFTDFGITKKYFEEINQGDNPIVEFSFGGAGIKKDSFENHLQRIPMDEKSLTARTIIHSEYLYYILKAPFLRNKIHRK